MALHVALLDPVGAEAVGAVARCCLAADASLHLVGPLGFDPGDPRVIAAGPEEWEGLDWWHHPVWRDFRDAMSRERCLYFAQDGALDPIEAPFRANSVLVFGDERLGLPERIREKYPDRVYRLPRAVRGKSPSLAGAIEVTLAFAGKRLAPRDAPAPRSRRRGKRG